MNESLQKRYTTLESLIAVQRDFVPVTHESYDYMHGMLNGMILAHSVFTDGRPKYYTSKRKQTKNKVRHKVRR